MKTYKEFCRDANIQENWFNDASNAITGAVRNVTNTLGITKAPPPKPQQVLAYRNYKPGVLDKTTEKFTQRAHTKAEQERYGWKPVEITGYNPTGNLTASGKPFTKTTPPSVAVPYVSKTNKNPRIPFETKLTFTNAPMGTKTNTVDAEVTDTGSFGRRGDPSSVNQNTYADASPTLQCELDPKSCGNTNKFGRRYWYVRRNTTTTTYPNNKKK